MIEERKTEAAVKKRSGVKGVEKFRRLGDGYPGDIVLHIGKTGGTYIGEVLRRLKPAKDRIRLVSHMINAANALKACPNARIVFSIRDPLSLFVSAFNSRLRKGQPRYNVMWTSAEAIAFSLFQTPNDLAEALSSDDRARQACAEFSMISIKHVNKCLSFYLDSEEFLEQHKRRIGFVLDQPSLDSDLEQYFALHGLNYARPSSSDEEVLKHMTPAGYARDLSPLARENLMHWFAKDIRIYDWCRRNKEQINSARA